MRRIRNPRYAPEFLERKLSPSGIVGNLGVAAQYSTPTPATSATPVAPTTSDFGLNYDPAANFSCCADANVDYDYSYCPDTAGTPADDYDYSYCPDTADVDPFEDPFVQDAPDDPPTADDPSFVDELPDVEPLEPEPPDLVDGQPPFEPLPLAPIGPAGPA